MSKNFWCKIGFHKWGKSFYSDYGATSNVLNYKKKCDRCGKVKTWVQAKGVVGKY
ncbi:hypothetical protein GOV08_03660 [Candidatus Woesearchaeota archaeon]|nr:hypothetical protein [Candidatus Woesearchaeota archaeon]